MTHDAHKTGEEPATSSQNQRRRMLSGLVRNTAF
jgi:hypothetical protein